MEEIAAKEISFPLDDAQEEVRSAREASLNRPSCRDHDFGNCFYT